MPDSRMPGDEIGARDDGSPRPGTNEVRAALERILASRCFQQAGRASDFLRFVVEQTLAGSGHRLKGYTIGIEVFGRPADFDAQSDALVRVEAGRLRRRLVEYYASEGAADPVRIELPRGSYAAEYRFARLDEQAASATPQPPVVESPAGSFHWRRIAVGLAALLVAAVGVIAWQQWALRGAARSPAAVDEPPRTDWPRIVVVPFENLSGNRALDALAASMTEEIMLRLHALDLFVVASQARWYAASGDETTLGEGAGDYVLTGSVRGSEADGRIAVRLIEAGTGRQLWTAAYDEPLKLEQLPALQERVARDVVAIGAPYGPIFEAELTRARRSAQAPKLRNCLAKYHEYRRRMGSTAHESAVACFQDVSLRRPDVAAVWAGLALLYVDEYSSSFGRTGDDALDSARAATAKALALDRDDFLANLALTRVQFFDGDPAFRQTIERTLELRPSSAQALAQGGFLLTITGDSAQGLPLLEKARELSRTPAGPPRLYHMTYALAYLRERRFNDALASAQKSDAQSWVVAQAVIAAAAAHSGRPDVAQGAVERLRKLYPQFEADALTTFERWHFDQALYDVFVSGLEAAGLDLKEPNATPSSG